VDALRYYVAVAGPETHDTDFTWSEFVRRNNDELVATWGNLVNRAVSFGAKNIGSIPAAGELTDADRSLLAVTAGAFDVVGENLGQSRFKFAVNDAMRAVAEANKYFSEQAPWKLRTSDPERMKTVLHVTLQAVSDAKTLLTPFLPRSSQAVHEMLGGAAGWSGTPRIETVDEEGGPSYPVITGDYDSTFRWESRPVAVGTPLAVPAPLFTKLDPSVIDEELARLGGGDD
jgi:methionyl-tRNA synthetase